ncbi:MAG: universal stress protein [Holophagaceae bacterium]|nr:universal stress protein [Holophagaceae bacterium]
MFQSVLVGVDFSEASRQALNRARSLAERLGAPLTALHVLQLPPPLLPEVQLPLPDPDWTQDMERRAGEQLEKWIEGFPNAQAMIRWGNPAEELVAAADPESLLVVAQVGHSTWERLLFGSTAARVVRHAPCDVLVVRAEQKRKP